MLHSWQPITFYPLLHGVVQRIELEAVKRERSHLMASLAEIKTQSGKAGGELQQEDLRRLRKEVELKMEKLNEIRKVSSCLLPKKGCTAWQPLVFTCPAEHLCQVHS